MGVSPIFQLPVMFLQVEVDVVDFIELLPVCPVRPFHLSVQFGRVGRKLKKEDLSLPASLLKLILELRAAIDLDGCDRKRKFLAQILSR